MGVYIKGLTKEDWNNLTIEEIEESFEIVEIKTPHGRLMDKDEFKDYIYDKYAMSAYSHQMDRFLNELYTNTPTVIEAEDK